ncbi:hypothetical protein [Corynebacterium doosanense]|uniref:RNA helicase n=1 Tax=Corynebacterium doosanense CAU 212 = DSM 45436 TaxID=558173 RepID=A0A097IFM0_9CORY|nr:hypothetical protein [Corynebacterium doosanense]AIT60936.1 RNA helicase [Corynebacterium doosanense CAU 212 = DSM 45436]
MNAPTRRTSQTSNSTKFSKPRPGQVAAAKLIIKRNQEGKGRVEITPRIKYLSEF